MFGEYAQVASYMQPARNAAYQSDILHHGLPSYLTPNFHPPHTWDQGRTKSGLTEDFIMIAEFSELEGPKPLMTIPKDGGANFDQNSFAVRILAVDHHNPTAGFSISEDAQIVLTDGEAGVFAFVHHMVLYDNTARGFVRPYCIAFITAEQRKLMCFYEELSWKFKKVSRILKYGNKMVFVGDLERHLKDLEYTKNVLLNQVCKMRLRSTDGLEDQVTDVRKNAENELYRGLQTIQQSNSEIRDILSILKPLLPDRRLEARFRILEDRAYQGYSSVGLDKLSLPESGFADFFSAVDELDFRYGSLTEPRISPLALFKPREYRPVLIETKKAKRFNAPLRGLHELCSWGAKEGLRKLRHIQTYFKRDMAVLELHKNESKLFRPRQSSIYHGQCITGNFLSGVQLKKSLDATEEMEQNWSLMYNYHWGSVGSLESEDSFKSADSYPSGNDYTNSPNSFQTYDSCNIFQSATGSPDKEFSLLMSNEYYYPDMKMNQEDEITDTESKVSNDLNQNETNLIKGAMDITLINISYEDSLKHLQSSSWNDTSYLEGFKLDGDVIKNLSRSDSVLASIKCDIPQPENNIVSGSSHNFSGKILDANVQVADDNHVNNMNKPTLSSEKDSVDASQELPYTRDEHTHNNDNLNAESRNSAFVSQSEIAENCLADINFLKVRDVSEENKVLTQENQNGISNNASKSAILSDANYITESLEKITLSPNAAQSLSSESCQNSLENIITDFDSDGNDYGNKVPTSNTHALENVHSITSVGSSNAPILANKENMDAVDTNQANKLSMNCSEILPLKDSKWTTQNSSKNISIQTDSDVRTIKTSTISLQNNSEKDFCVTEIPQNKSENFGSENPHLCIENIQSNLQQDSMQDNSQNAFGVTQSEHKIVENNSKILNSNKQTNNDNGSVRNNTDKQLCSSENRRNGLQVHQNSSRLSQRVTDFEQSVHESTQNIPVTSQKSNEIFSNVKTENKNLSEINGRLVSHGLKKMIAPSDLSHSNIPDFQNFDHHISKVNHLRNEKGHSSMFNSNDDLTRARTESDMSSAYTEISMQDYYPQVNSIESEAKNYALYDVTGASIHNENTDIPTSPSMVLWKPRCGMYTVGDWINNLSQSRPGFGLSEVLLNYQCLEHVVFSLLCGRPVLVAGSAKMETEVIKIVNALAVFVPVVKRKSQTVLEWTSSPLKITDLMKLKLIGVCRPDRRSLDSFVPGAIKKACTIIDVEKKLIVAPPYQGQFISALMSKKNVLQSDVKLLTYVEWWLMGIVAKAFIFFHNFCLGSVGSVLYSQSPKDQRDAYHSIVSGIMARLGVKDGDCDIVENLTEIVKLNKLETELWQGVDSGSVVSPLTLQHKTCERFRC